MGSMWAEDQKVERPDEETLEALYRQYGEQGHLVLMAYVNGDQAGESWVIFCSCGATPWGAREELMGLAGRLEASGGSDLAHPVPYLLTYDEAVWWARDHRTSVGLAWQDWTPSQDFHVVAERKRRWEEEGRLP